MQKVPYNHPIWVAVKYVSVILAVGFVSWLNASNFDETELKMLFEVSLILLAGLGAKGRIERE